LHAAAFDHLPPPLFGYSMCLRRQGMTSYSTWLHVIFFLFWLFLNHYSRNESGETFFF
jgi:hypothetical protein